LWFEIAITFMFLALPSRWHSVTPLFLAAKLFKPAGVLALQQFSPSCRSSSLSAVDNDLRFGGSNRLSSAKC
jgi:hypothetical protein